MTHSNDKNSISLGSSFSLSEPPDVRNWFSSYAYHSPDLGLEDSVCEKEREVKERCAFDIGETGCDSNNPEKNNDSSVIGNRQDSIEVLECMSSPSMISEPPDIRNWFSSYLYESLPLGRSIRIDESVTRDDESDKSRPVVEENNSETEEAFAVKVDSAEPESKVDSYISEAPDVRNWFSSYAYESPVLSGSAYVGVSALEENDCEKERPVEESSKKEEEDPLKTGSSGTNYKLFDAEKAFSNGLGKHDSSFGNNKQDNKKTGGKRWLADQSIKHYAMELEQSSGNEVLPGVDISHKDFEESNLCFETSLSKATVDCRTNTSFTTTEMKVTSGIYKGNRTDSRAAHENVDSTETEAKLECPSNEDSLRKSPCVSYGEPPGNGFIATKKSRLEKASDRDRMKRKEKILPNCSKKNVIGSAVAEENVVKRKVFEEITNLEYHNVTEVTGKWRCPQKRKPNLGPPLKQLRLEKWVTKV